MGDETEKDTKDDGAEAQPSTGVAPWGGTWEGGDAPAEIEPKEGT